jgi:hypothetical protein
MAYVYRHIRLDKNEPFYIGIGITENYSRAYSKKSRNKLWKTIANKSAYEVEIVFDDLSWEEACNKEKEFIELYGRIDNKSGILSNMTNGGDGTIGIKVWNKGKKLSQSHIDSLSKAQTGLKRSRESILKAIETKKKNFTTRGKIVLNTQNGIYYGSVSEAANSIGKKQSYLSHVLNGIIKQNRTNFIYA